MSEPAIEIAGLTKTFGANRVLRGIDLRIEAGEITVLMGANGAGKSTLVKVVSGVHQADGGAMRLGGRAFAPRNPIEAIRAGVVTVHQNINDGVIPDLDVASNLMLDKLAEPGGGIFLKGRELRRQAREVAASMGLEVDVRRPVRDLQLADRQLVAIARAMARKPELLILDEPTSSLSAAEAERLFALLERLRDRGVAILYISHRTSDIRRLADRIHAMRDGRIVGSFTEKPLDYEAAVAAMLGQGLDEIALEHNQPGEKVLELRDLVLAPGARPINLSVHRDEVLTVTGLVGAGKTLLAEILFGQRAPVSGEILLEGRPYRPRSARDAIDAGVFLCPKDRASTGVLAGHSLAKNTTVPFLERFSRLSFVNRAAEARATRALIEDLGIVCQSEHDDIGVLSGGNQQKVMVARWLGQPSKVLILDEPFQGVDIKARRDIGAKIRETARGRASIVMASEMDEVLEIADRIVVLSDRHVVGDHRNRDLDIRQVLSEVAGQEGIPDGAGEGGARAQ